MPLANSSIKMRPVRSTEDELRVLLRRCRKALAIGAPEWERDVETAMELDAALVADIDAALGAE